MTSTRITVLHHNEHTATSLSARWRMVWNVVALLRNASSKPGASPGSGRGARCNCEKYWGKSTVPFSIIFSFQLADVSEKQNSGNSLFEERRCERVLLLASQLFFVWVKKHKLADITSKSLTAVKIACIFEIGRRRYAAMHKVRLQDGFNKKSVHACMYEPQHVLY